MSGELTLDVDASPPLAMSVETQELLLSATEVADLRLEVDSTTELMMAVDSQELSLSSTEPIELVLQIESQQLELGTASVAVGTDSALLPPADMIDDTGATYFYFGWLNVSGSWLVRRQLRANSATTDATVINNATHTILAQAWAVKETLNYE